MLRLRGCSKNWVEGNHLKNVTRMQPPKKRRSFLCVVRLQSFSTAIFSGFKNTFVVTTPIYTRSIEYILIYGLYYTIIPHTSLLFLQCFSRFYFYMLWQISGIIRCVYGVKMPAVIIMCVVMRFSYFITRKKK